MKLPGSDASDFQATASLHQYLGSWGPLGVRSKRMLGDIGLRASASWPRSRLTPTGAPLEFCFAEEGGGLRYTVECGAPRANPELRLSDICKFLLRRGVPLPIDLLERVTDFQSRGLLTYGAWLGVRHDYVDDRFKIYAEVPPAAAPSAEAWVAGILGAPLRLPGPAATIKMFGLSAGSVRVEAYYASVDMLRGGLSMAMERVGLSSASDAVLAVVDGMTPFSPGARLPARDVGFSYAFAPGEPEAVFTLYLVARKLFGDDQACAEWIGGRLPGHGDLMRVLSAAPPGVTHHGMVGLSIAAGFARPILSAGVAAPWMS